MERTYLQLSDEIKKLRLLISNKDKSELDFFRYLKPLKKARSDEIREKIRRKFRKAVQRFCKKYKENKDVLPNALIALQDIMKERRRKQREILHLQRINTIKYLQEKSPLIHPSQDMNSTGMNMFMGQSMGGQFGGGSYGGDGMGNQPMMGFNNDNSILPDSSRQGQPGSGQREGHGKEQQELEMMRLKMEEEARKEKAKTNQNLSKLLSLIEVHNGTLSEIESKFKKEFIDIKKNLKKIKEYKRMQAENPIKTEPQREVQEHVERNDRDKIKHIPTGPSDPEESKENPDFTSKRIEKNKKNMENMENQYKKAAKTEKENFRPSSNEKFGNIRNSPKIANINDSMSVPDSDKEDTDRKNKTDSQKPIEKSKKSSDGAIGAMFGKAPSSKGIKKKDSSKNKGVKTAKHESVQPIPIENPPKMKAPMESNDDTSSLKFIEQPEPSSKLESERKEAEIEKRLEDRNYHTEMPRNEVLNAPRNPKPVLIPGIGSKNNQRQSQDKEEEVKEPLDSPEEIQEKKPNKFLDQKGPFRPIETVVDHNKDTVVSQDKDDEEESDEFIKEIESETPTALIQNRSSSKKSSQRNQNDGYKLSNQDENLNEKSDERNRRRGRDDEPVGGEEEVPSRSQHSFQVDEPPVEPIEEDKFQPNSSGDEFSVEDDEQHEYDGSEEDGNHDTNPKYEENMPRLDENDKPRESQKRSRKKKRKIKFKKSGRANNQDMDEMMRKKTESKESSKPKKGYTAYLEHPKGKYQNAVSSPKNKKNALASNPFGMSTRPNKS